jgi:hypothetical protein
MCGRSPITIGKSPITIRRSPITIGKSPITIRRSPITIGKSPITIGRSPVTAGKSPVTKKTCYIDRRKGGFETRPLSKTCPCQIETGLNPAPAWMMAPI